jgi:hypothetical protein
VLNRNARPAIVAHAVLLTDAPSAGFAVGSVSILENNQFVAVGDAFAISQ